MVSRQVSRLSRVCQKVTAPPRFRVCRADLASGCCGLRLRLHPWMCGCGATTDLKKEWAWGGLHPGTAAVVTGGDVVCTAAQLRSPPVFFGGPLLPCVPVVGTCSSDDGRPRAPHQPACPALQVVGHQPCPWPLLFSCHRPTFSHSPFPRLCLPSLPYSLAVVVIVVETNIPTSPASSKGLVLSLTYNLWCDDHTIPADQDFIATVF